MGLRSGLGGFLGVGAETTYGTAATFDRFFEFSQESLERQPEYAQGGGIKNGTFLQSGSRRRKTTEMAGGTFQIDVPDSGFGLIIQTLLGSTATATQQATSAAYLQTHTLGDAYGKSLTVQKGVPEISSGTAQPYTLLGQKVSQLELTCNTSELLQSTVTLTGQKMVESVSAATPTYTAGLGNFPFLGMTVKSGTFGSEVALSSVTGISLTIETPLHMPQWAGNGGFPSEPFLNDWVKITGTLDMEFNDKTEVADIFAADTATSLVIEFIGDLIETSYYNSLTITLPDTFFESGTSPKIDSNDVVKVSAPFTVQDDDTNEPITIAYQSTDTAV